jgi:hypothetical protein
MLGAPVRGFRGPIRRLVTASLALAVLAAITAAIGISRGGSLHAVAAGLWLASGALSVRARSLSLRCPLGTAQRGVLLRRLTGAAALEVRVSAVNDAHSIRYARALREVLGEAAWPVGGVYKWRVDVEPSGVALAVRNILAPPGEAVTLIDALRRVGIPVSWAHKPALADDRTVEILVGELS